MESRFALFLAVISWLLTSCGQEKAQISSIDPVSWSKRSAQLPDSGNSVKGQTYLSVYSQIYSQSEQLKHDLTATISMRNTSLRDTVYIVKAVYYNTEGKAIREYLPHPIYLAPMETVEIVIDETDQEGGTGANFIFDWQVPSAVHAPLFEGVMISTSGQQGLSFTTAGVTL